jgi:DNA-binding response OmpR family regulator
MIPQETLRELVQLRERVADLEAELAELKTTSREDELNVHRLLNLPVGVSKMLIALARGGIMSREQLIHYGCDNHEEGSLRLVDSMVKRLRRALPWLRIKTHYGYGYEMAPESIARVRQAMRGEMTQ